MQQFNRHFILPCHSIPNFIPASNSLIGDICAPYTPFCLINVIPCVRHTSPYLAMYKYSYNYNSKLELQLANVHVATYVYSYST